MDRVTQPYELSIWQDNWDTDKLAYVDKKILVIGNHKDKHAYQAQNVVFTRNVDGTSTVAFTMYYKYRDETTGELIDNPYISMLVNERKIKLKYADKWDFDKNDWTYEWKDYFIKTAQEASDKKSISYVCKDAFITELSKNGFAIELDPELENNQGNITDLAAYILKDTDWKVGPSDTIQQRVEDYTYEITTLTNFTAYTNGVATTIPSGSKILVYYTSITNKNSFLQFLYNANGQYPVDSERIVVDTPEYNATATYTETATQMNVLVGGTTIFSIPNTQIVSSTSKGMRYVRQAKTVLDPVTNEYVGFYTYNGNTIYGYTTTEYLEPLTVTNYVTNNKEMISNAGWYAYNNNTTSVFLPYVPPYSGSDNMPIYLQVKLGSGQTRFMNTSLSDSRGLLPGGIAAGEKYTLRMKYKAGTTSGAQSGLTAVVARYNTTTMTYTTSDIVFTFNSFSTVNGYAQMTAAASQPVTQADLFGVTYKYGLFFTGASGQTYYLQDIQLFKTVFDADNNQVYPDTINVTTQFRFLYSYYKPDPAVTSADKVQYLYRDYTPWSAATILYSENYEKIRSITASKSNCFNLIQQLAETFECWAQFNIGHNDDGSLKLIQQDGVWVPDKTISFVEFLGQENALGFKYGINLTSVQRNIESEQIVSKLIVEPNSNEFAPDGFCTIAYAGDNLSQEAFILNFDYYIQHGLLNQAEVLRDLYITIGSQKGYLAALRELNLQIQEEQDVLSGLYRAIDQQEYMQELYTAMLQESTTLANQSASAILSLTKLSTLSAALAQVSKTTATATEQRYYQEYMTYKANIATSQSILTQVNTALEDLERRLDNINIAVDYLTEEKEKLNLAFYKRYSRFIQEGSWIDENYIDPNLYYLDAQSVLYNSAFPQVSYTINVIDLSPLEDYRHYTYNLGDKTTIEDIEFFGYSDYATRTPYKEQVIISQIVINFDDAKNNKITIQNFKSQFQDLFQRITATTNSLQYNTGAYQRAAAAINSNGEINIETLQNSLINNSLVIASAQNESFIQDSNGIAAIDLDDPLNVMKLQSKGLFLSTDGGATWTMGIRANGINTQALTAGSILVDRIFIQGTGGNAFRWDEHGLNAYANLSQGGRATYSFVRFDNYGIYGINKSELTDEEYVPADEQAIWDDAQFGMTWRGFFIKNKYGPGWVEVSSENDVAIYDGILQRIKLGNFGTPNAPLYGLVIHDDAGQNRITIGNLNTADTPIYGLKIQDENGQIGVYTDDQGQFYGQHIYIGPKVYDTRAQLGIVEEYIQSTTIGTVEEYSATTEYTSDIIVSYNGTYYTPTNDFDGTQLMPVPGTATDWTPVQIEYSKILSINDVNGDEQIALYDDGTAVFRQASVSGAINATSGMIGGLTITDTGFSGFGFTVGSNGMLFDTTTNPNGFTLYHRLTRNFNSETSYNTGDIIIYDGHIYMALQDMVYDGATPVPTPSGATDTYWELDDSLDARTVMENIFSIQDNELIMIGNGTFTGTITATSGSFNGEIYATRGYVGGLILESNVLYSGNARPYDTENDFTAGSAIWYNNARYIALVDIPAEAAPPPGQPGWEDYWALDTDYGMADSPFSIDALGHIIANSITLGTSATIADYIKLGNSYIYNPETNNNQFISVKDSTDTSIFSLDNAGLMSIGKDNNKIYIDGAQSIIQGNNWSISPNVARFSNVAVSGTIRTTIFEKDSIQSVNSALILSTSSAVRDFNPSIMTIWVDYIEGQYSVGDWAIIADDSNRVSMKIYALTAVTPEGWIGLDFTGNVETGTVTAPVSITRLGQTGQFHIGVNSSDAGIFDLFAPRAITMMQLVETDDNITSDYKVIVGKLNGINQISAYLPDAADVDRYGLYADFAYLKGAIVSETVSDDTGQPVYTGLNTLNGTNNQNPVDDPLYNTVLDDTSKIVLWAGAAGLDPAEINKAPFKVTERGYLYAQRGVFSGSVLSESVITDSVIVADSIHISPNSSSLHIYDTDVSGEENIPGGTRLVRGIIFSTGTSNNHKHRVGIDSQGIRFYENGDTMGIFVGNAADPMIDTNGHAHLTSLNVLNKNGTLTHYLDIYPNQIQNKPLTSESSENYTSRIYFDTSGIINFDIETNRTLTVTQSDIKVQNDLKVLQDFILGSVTDSGTRMSYRKVDQGYDLYVEED